MKKILAVILALTIGACTQVDTGHRGVKTYWGEVDMQAGPLPEGLYWYNPISTNIIEIDTRVQRMEHVTNTYTKDVQQADIKFVVNYRLDPSVAHTMYRDVGWNWAEKLLLQAIEGPLKQVVGTYEAVDLIANRAEATARAREHIHTLLADRHIYVDRFELVDIAFLKDFEKSVEDKVVAIQRAIEEQNRTKQVEEKAKQQVISAKAQAESMRIRAQALESNPKLIEYEAVQKWDGKLPQYTLGGSVPFVNVTPSK